MKSLRVNTQVDRSVMRMLIGLACGEAMIGMLENIFKRFTTDDQFPEDAQCTQYHLDEIAIRMFSPNPQDYIAGEKDYLKVSAGDMETLAIYCLLSGRWASVVSTADNRVRCLMSESVTLVTDAVCVMDNDLNLSVQSTKAGDSLGIDNRVLVEQMQSLREEFKSQIKEAQLTGFPIWVAQQQPLETQSSTATAIEPGAAAAVEKRFADGILSPTAPPVQITTDPAGLTVSSWSELVSSWHQLVRRLHDKFEAVMVSEEQVTSEQIVTFRKVWQGVATELNSKKLQPGHWFNAFREAMIHHPYFGSSPKFSCSLIDEAMLEVWQEYTKDLNPKSKRSQQPRPVSPPPPKPGSPLIFGPASHPPRNLGEVAPGDYEALEKHLVTVMSPPETVTVNNYEKLLPVEHFLNYFKHAREPEGVKPLATHWSTIRLQIISMYHQFTVTQINNCRLDVTGRTLTEYKGKYGVDLTPISSPFRQTTLPGQSTASPDPDWWKIDVSKAVKTTYVTMVQTDVPGFDAEWVRKAAFYVDGKLLKWGVSGQTAQSLSAADMLSLCDGGAVVVVYMTEPAGKTSNQRWEFPEHLNDFYSQTRVTEVNQGS